MRENSYAVVQAVADAEGVEPTELPALDETIDSHALDALFEGRETNGALTFEYCEHSVTVTSDGRVDVDLLRRS